MLNLNKILLGVATAVSLAGCQHSETNTAPTPGLVVTPSVVTTTPTITTVPATTTTTVAY